MVAAFWTLFENDPKWQLPCGFSFFKHMHFWTFLATIIELEHFWYAQNVATFWVLVCYRHHCFLVRHRAWPTHAAFCWILQRFRMFAGCSLWVMQDAVLQRTLNHFNNELFSLSSSVSHHNRIQHFKCVIHYAPKRMRLIIWRRASNFFAHNHWHGRSTSEWVEWSWVELSWKEMSESMNDWVSEWLTDWATEWVREWGVMEWVSEGVRVSVNQWVSESVSQ